MIFLFILAMIPRCWALDTPYPWDESIFLRFARSVAKAPLNPKAQLTWPGSGTSDAPLLGYMLALWWLAFGESYFSSHLLVAILGSISIVLTYVIGRRFYGRIEGFVGSILLSFCPVHWMASRGVLLDIPSLFFFLCSLILFYEGAKSESGSLLLLGGILGGLASLAKYSGLLVVPIAGTYFVTKLRASCPSNPWKYIISLLLPFLMLSPWLLYSKSQGLGFARWYEYLARQEARPLDPGYVLFQSVFTSTLLCSVLLATVPLAKTLRAYLSFRKTLVVLAGSFLALLCLTAMVTYFVSPSDMVIQGVVVRQLLEVLGSPLSELVRIAMILVGFLSIIGMSLEFLDGSPHGRFLELWTVFVIIAFVLFLPVKYPRYLIQVLPVVHLAIGKVLSPILKNKSTFKVAFAFLVVALMSYIAVGYYSNLHLIMKASEGAR